MITPVTIEEYIKYNHRQLTNPIYLEKREMRDLILDGIQRLCLNYQMEFIVIYSSSIYPYYLEKNKKFYLIWDEHFWNLYDCYLDIIFREASHEVETDVLVSKAFSLMQIILSHTMEAHPSLSRSFAVNYQKTGAVFGFYDDKLSCVPFSDYADKWSIYSRMYAAYHEIAHFEYNKIDPDAKKKAKLKFMQFAQRLQPDDPLYNAIALPYIQNLVYYVNLTIKNNNETAIEELFCDLQACDRLMRILVKDNGEIKENAEMTICIAMLLNRLIAAVNQSTAYWEIYYKNWRKAEDINQFISICNREKPVSVVTEQFLRVLMLYLAFLWECEKGYEIYFLKALNSQIFDKAAFYLHEWNFVYETLFFEKKFYEGNTPRENRALKDELLHWK